MCNIHIIVRKALYREGFVLELHCRRVDALKYPEISVLHFYLVLQNCKISYLVTKAYTVLQCKDNSLRDEIGTLFRNAPASVAPRSGTRQLIVIYLCTMKFFSMNKSYYRSTTFSVLLNTFKKH